MYSSAAEGYAVGVTAPQYEQEEMLVRRVQTGDDAAFDRLVELCSARVYSLAYRMLGNADDAQDVAQEALVRVYQAIPKFRSDAAFSTWLYRIVANACHDELARRKRRPASASELMHDDDAPSPLERETSGDGPDLAYERHERQQAIQRALQQIAVPFREVIILCDVQGLSYQEAAEVLRTGLGTVKSRLNRGRNALREILRAERELFGLEASQKP